MFTDTDTTFTAGDRFEFEGIPGCPIDGPGAVEETRPGLVIRIDAIDFLGCLKVTVGRYSIGDGERVPRYTSHADVRITEAVEMIKQGIWERI